MIVGDLVLWAVRLRDNSRCGQAWSQLQLSLGLIAQWTNAPAIITKIPQGTHWLFAVYESWPPLHVSVLVASRGNVSCTDPIWCSRDKCLSTAGAAALRSPLQLVLDRRKIRLQLPSRGRSVSGPTPCDFRRNRFWLSTDCQLPFTLRLVQPIPFGVTFSNAVSKLKAQSSNVCLHWNVAKETFELRALSFRKCHPTWDWLYDFTIPNVMCFQKFIFVILL